MGDEKSEAVKVGAPSKYYPDMCAQIISHMTEGDSKEAACARIGITKPTLYDWCDPESERYKEEFSYAVKEGEALSQLWWEDKIKAAAVGENKDANATLMIFNMKNRFKNDWADMQVHEQRHKFAVSDEPIDSDEWLSQNKPK